MVNEDRKKDVIHVAVSPWNLSDDYNRHCGVLMVSILENTTSSVYFHLLYDERLSTTSPELAELNKSYFSKICNQYHAKIEYRPLHIHEQLEQIPAINIYSVGSLLRLYLPEILSDINKVLYLDTDIVVTLDIQELWDYDVTNSYLAARIDQGLPRKRVKIYNKMNIDSNKYFNSGVLLLNLENIRKDMNLSHVTEDYLLTHPNLGWPDQDVLNFYLQDSLLPLPKKYNYPACGVECSGENRFAIFHFAGRQKPWKMYWGGVDKYYWEYFSLTPWASNPEKLIEYVRIAPDIQIGISRLADWIFLSYPMVQIHKVWLIVKSAVFRVIKKDIQHLYHYILHGENYLEK